MDTQRSHEYKRKILSSLLSKYERSQSFQTGTPSKQRPQMSLKGSDLEIDYYDEMDYQSREGIHAALQELIQEGTVTVTWSKLMENIEVNKIYLDLEGLEKAYKLIGRMPKETKIRQLELILAPLSMHPWDWVSAWWEETNHKLQKRKPTGMDLDDLPGYHNLIRVLMALPEIEESTPKRVLSQALFHDSKRFEQGVDRRLLSLLRKIYPEELEKDEDYLDQVGIAENPKQTLVCGPLQINMGQNKKSSEQSLAANASFNMHTNMFINLGFFRGGVGLSAESIKELSIHDIPAKTILLVENLTTYHEVCQRTSILRPPVLVIYTGGFPHKSIQKLLYKISEFISENQNQIDVEAVYHWGDIDYGGIQIFEYLKKNFFPSLKQYRMDVPTYRKYVNSGLPFGDDPATKLERLLSEPSYEAWYPVIAELLKHRKRVEQESIRDC